MTKRPRKLGEAIVANGTANGLRMEALLTSMDAPLGKAVGNSLESIEAIETLKGKGPKDLEELSVELAARMIRLAGIAKTMEDATAKIRDALTSGAGLEKFRECIEHQGGDPKVVDDYSRMPSASHKEVFAAPTKGFVTGLDAGLIGRASVVLGAGRDRVEDPVDPGVGIMLLKKPGDEVAAKEPILEVHHRSNRGLQACMDMLQRAVTIADKATKMPPLIRDAITGK